MTIVFIFKAAKYVKGLPSMWEALSVWLSAMQEPQEMQVQSLGQEYPLEEEMTTYSSIFCCENPMDRGAWKATVHRVTKSRKDVTEVWCWRGLLTVPWTARRSNQSMLKQISPGCSLEGLMLKLKLQYFGYLMRRADSLEKTLMLGGIGGRRRRG